MEIKKNPKSNLENFSKIFMQIGLVLALFVTYVAIEKKTYDKIYGNLGSFNMNQELEEEIPITQKIEQVQPKTPPPPAPEKIEIVENEKEIKETVLESTETDQTEKVVVIVEMEEEEEVVEDVNFMIIEDVPTYPGCSGNNQERKDCFSRMVQKHFGKKFNADLPNELGLSPGKKKVFIGFKIDKNGNVVDIQTKAPHPKIKDEVEKVMSQLPKMKPGKQRGKPVGVKYSIPFTLIVE